jgi:hypothetical protein
MKKYSKIFLIFVFLISLVACDMGAKKPGTGSVPADESHGETIDFDNCTDDELKSYVYDNYLKTYYNGNFPLSIEWKDTEIQQNHYLAFYAFNKYTREEMAASVENGLWINRDDVLNYAYNYFSKETVDSAFKSIDWFDYSREKDAFDVSRLNEYDKAPYDMPQYDSVKIERDGDNIFLYYHIDSYFEGQDCDLKLTLERTGQKLIFKEISRV